MLSIFLEFRPRLRKRRLHAVAAAMVLGLPATAHAAAVDAYYERSVMSAAGERCGLFTPSLASALASSQAQARGAALRSGVDPASLDRVAQRARSKAYTVPCASSDIRTPADRVRTAFAAYAKLTKMSFPGDLNAWSADRTAYTYAGWRLSQPAAFGWDRMIFGIAGQDNESGLLAVAVFADGANPYAARLVMRDPARASGPYLDSLLATPSSRLPLAQRTPPRYAARVFQAQARDTAGVGLLPKGAKTGVAFRFPSQAAAALAALDPREAIAVEFVFAGRSGDQVRTAYVEVGDFAAARAFLAVAQR